jgi:hypothetical protein
MDKINVGSYVKITNPGRRYPDYIQWLIKRDLSLIGWNKDFENMEKNINIYDFVVLHKSKSDTYSERIMYYIECIQNGTKIIIDNKGIKLNDKKIYHPIIKDIFEGMK